MDPEAAVDNLRDSTRDAEKFLRAAARAKTKAQAKSLHRSARESLEEAGEAQHALFMWLSRGGFRPRRFDTWLDRYVRANQEWSRQAKVL